MSSGTSWCSRVGQRRVEHLGAGVAAPCRTRRPPASSRPARAGSARRRRRSRRTAARRRPRPTPRASARAPRRSPTRWRRRRTGPSAWPPASTWCTQVAELVEQRDHVVVLHQRLARSCRPARPRRAGGPAMPGGEVELRGVLVLARRAGAGRGGSGRAGAPPAQHVVRRRRPRARRRVGDLDVLARRRAGRSPSSSPAAHLGEVEVGAHLLGVDVEAAPGAAPRSRTPCRRCRPRSTLGVVLPQPLQQHVDVAAGRRRRRPR